MVFSFMSTFLQLERQRLGLSAAKVVESIKGSRATYTRWEAGAAIPSDKLFSLAELGFDVAYVITGIRSNVEVLQTGDTLNQAEDTFAGFETPPSQATTPAPLSREEAALLDNFRHCSPKAQAAIKATSDALAQRESGNKTG